MPKNLGFWYIFPDLTSSKFFMKCPPYCQIWLLLIFLIFFVKKSKILLLHFKGLRNALKKSKTHRRSEESLELQPLHPPNHNNKATLKRMSRVKSHDLSQEEGERRETSACEPVISPIGAGLPLLQRLK